MNILHCYSGLVKFTTEQIVEIRTLVKKKIDGNGFNGVAKDLLYNLVLQQQPDFVDWEWVCISFRDAMPELTSVIEPILTQARENYFAEKEEA